MPISRFSGGNQEREGNAHNTDDKPSAHGE